MPDAISTPEHLKVPIKDIYTPDEAASLLRMSRQKLFKLSRRREDPFPLLLLPDSLRGAIVLREDLLAWAKRNYEPISKR